MTGEEYNITSTCCPAYHNLLIQLQRFGLCDLCQLQIHRNVSKFHLTQSDLTSQAREDFFNSDVL